MWPNIWKEIPLFPRRRAITTLSPRTVAPPEPLVHRVHMQAVPPTVGTAAASQQNEPMGVDVRRRS
jgi:hypothetical protein